MAPSEVNATNQKIVWQRLYGHEGGGTPKFRIGDRVCISKDKRHFEKGYMANWTEELFTIVEAHRSDPPVYGFGRLARINIGRHVLRTGAAEDHRTEEQDVLSRIHPTLA